MEIIRSLDNKKIKLYASLKNKKYRDEYGLFIVQQQHMIQEALKAGLLDTLIVREGEENIFGVETLYVSDNVMKKLSDNVSLNKYLGICKIKEEKIENYKHLIVLDRVQDPGNLGTIIRTAYSFGYDGIFISDDSCDIYNQKTIQATQGALFHLNIERDKIENIITKLKNKKVEIIASSLNTDNYLSNFKAKENYALVLGNEGSGISEYVIKNCDSLVKIEMDNFESLNVAVAAAILMYQLKR